MQAGFDNVLSCLPWSADVCVCACTSVCVCMQRDESTKACVESETERRSDSSEMRGERERANIFLFTLDPLAESLQMEGILHAAVLHGSLLLRYFL